MKSYFRSLAQWNSPRKSSKVIVFWFEKLLLRTGLMFFFIIMPSWAQERLEIYGYFQSQLMGTVIDDDLKQVYTNKLRIDLKSELSQNITFAANFDYITYHGKTEWNILDFLAPEIYEDIPQAVRSFYVIPFNDESFLDNAYVKLAFKQFDLTVGKQQISLGTGYAWNPTDIFNIKDLLDPTYEQPGHNAVRFDLPIGQEYTLTAIYSPDENWKYSAKLIQLKGRISHFDYHLVAIDKVWILHDYTQFDFAQLNFLETVEKRRLWGASTAGELLGLGLWAEYGYNRMQKSKDFYELVIGSDYTFDIETYVMVEYYRNSLGKMDYKQYTINDWMRFFATEQKAISRDQVYTYIQHPASDLLSVGAFQHN